MYSYQLYHLHQVKEFKHKLLEYSRLYNYVSILDNHDYKIDPFSKYEFIAAFGAIDTYTLTSDDISQDKNTAAFKQELEDFIIKEQFVFATISYDLKNLLEDLKSTNHDGIGANELSFFQPKIIILIRNNKLLIQIDSRTKDLSPEIVFDQIINIDMKKNTSIHFCSDIKSRFSKEKYLDVANNLKKEITAGNIYEVNFCHEFYSDSCEINPLELSQLLINESPTPFASYIKLEDIYVLSASPERFLCKRGDQIISQPIKGTIRRGKDSFEDRVLKSTLQNDPKERSENIMIVDLVRNDLSRSARKGSVIVDELCEIYTFPQVHQMISTISSRLREDKSVIDVLLDSYPMGSMTGAPKVRAMQLIEEHEHSKRGLYSGSTGYFDPDGDFDFSVIIRSFIYNSTRKYLSFQVGGALTSLSNTENEYDETLLKAKALKNALSKTTTKTTKI